MRNRTSIIGIYLLVLVALGSCKYEDGPFFSLYSKKSRVVGYWDFDRVYINGENVTEEYANQIIQFKENGICIWYLDMNFTSYYNPNLDYTEIGSWEFQDKKEELFLEFSTFGQNPFSQIWDIKELRYHDMKLERTEADDRIIWELTKLD